MQDGAPPPVVSPPPLPGDQVGPYLLGEMVGVGGMATVYEASSETGGKVALKILHPGKAVSEEARRFRREFLALRRLRHESIVRVIEAGQHGDYPWIAMQFVDGTDLGTLIKRWKKDPPPDRFEQTEKILSQLCSALAYIHDQGFIHRDVKPSNVLVNLEGDAKLTDFGVVKSSGGAFTTQLTVAGKLVGTVAFMAPECITGEPIDQRSDLYSLGAVLYVMLTSQRPIVADSIAGYLARHLTETPSPPSEINPEIPPHLERISQKLLQKAPDDRFQSARDVLAPLEPAEHLLRSQMHGRGHELERLSQRRQFLEDGVGSVIVVSGEEGIGKSMLLDEFEKRARAAGYAVAVSSGKNADPLTHIDSQLPLGESSELLTDRRSIERISYRTNQSSWILIIDDLDHMERVDLLDFMNFVRQRIAIESGSMMIVASVTQTDGKASGFCQGTEIGLSPELIPLEGLDRRAIMAIVRDQGITGAAGAVLGVRLCAELHGVPGSVIEQVSALIEDEWLENRGSNNLHAKRSIEELRVARFPVPERLRRQEQLKLTQVAPEDRIILDGLAILNMEVSLDLLAEVIELPESEVAHSVENLVTAKFAKKWVEGLQEVVSISADRRRDIIYGLVPSENRISLHQRAAQALQRRSRRRIGTMSQTIAHHLLNSGDYNEAYPMLLTAARQCIRTNDPATALKLVQQAKNARSRAEQGLSKESVYRNRLTLFSIDAELMEEKGDLTGALSAWTEALSAAERGQDSNATARVRSGIGLVQAARGEADQACSGLEMAIHVLPKGDPIWPKVATALATSRLIRGDVDGADGLWQSLHDLGRATGNGLVTAEALAGTGMVSLVRGDLLSGRDALEHAEQLLSERRAPRSVIPISMILADLALIDGRLLEARERAIEAERKARETSRMATCIHAMGLLALVHSAYGDHAASRILTRDAMTLNRARSPNWGPSEVIAVVTVARALIETGAMQDAANILPDIGTTSISGLDDPLGQLLALQARIMAEHNPKQAKKLAGKALAQPPASFSWASARLRIDAALALENLDKRAAASALRRVLPQIEGDGVRLLRLEAHLLASRIGMDKFTQTADDLRAELSSELASPPGFLTRWSGTTG